MIARASRHGLWWSRIAHSRVPQVLSGGGLRSMWVASGQSQCRNEDPVPLALFDRACSWRNMAIEALEDAGQAYRIVFSGESVAGIKAAIENGFGRTGWTVNSSYPTSCGVTNRTLGQHQPRLWLRKQWFAQEAPGILDRAKSLCLVPGGAN